MVECQCRNVVVAQLVEQSLAIPEVRGSNPVIGKIYIEHLFTVNCIEKTKIKKKEAGNGPFLNNGGVISTNCSSHRTMRQQVVDHVASN